MMRVLGTPTDGYYGFELHPEAAKFLEREPIYAGRPLRAVIPQASDRALNLLQGERMWLVDTARQALHIHRRILSSALFSLSVCIFVPT